MLCNVFHKKKFSHFLIPDISPGFSENLRNINCAWTTTSLLPVLSRKLPVLCSFWKNQTQQFFDSDFSFPPKMNLELAVFWLRRIKQDQNPVVIKEIDTHPTLLRTLGPYDTFANPWSKARNTRSMTAPTEEKLTSSTLWSSSFFLSFFLLI